MRDDLFAPYKVLKGYAFAEASLHLDTVEKDGHVLA
jgi:hypothetical protein